MNSYVPSAAVVTAATRFPSTSFTEVPSARERVTSAPSRAVSSPFCTPSSSQFLKAKPPTLAGAKNPASTSGSSSPLSNHMLSDSPSSLGSLSSAPSSSASPLTFSSVGTKPSGVVNTTM